MLGMVMGWRAAVFLVFLAVFAACSFAEPSTQALAATGVGNLRAAKATHVEGLGSLAINNAVSLYFRLNGDAEGPDRTRILVEMSGLGVAMKVETISVDGKSFLKDPASGAWTESTDTTSINKGVDPFAAADLSAIRDITEVDRPTVDGRQTRHLRYRTDSGKLLEALRLALGSITRPHGTGELWIRVDDSQIVRQSVSVSFELDGAPDLGFGLIPTGSGKASIEMSLDVRFSKHGQPVATISPPPTR